MKPTESTYPDGPVAFEMQNKDIGPFLMDCDGFRYGLNGKNSFHRMPFCVVIPNRAKTARLFIAGCGLRVDLHSMSVSFYIHLFVDREEVLFRILCMLNAECFVVFLQNLHEQQALPDRYDRNVLGIYLFQP